MMPYSGFHHLVRNISILNFCLVSWNYFLIVNHSPGWKVQTFSNKSYRISPHWYTFSQLVWICLFFAWPNAPTHSLPSKTHMVLFCLIILFPLTCIDRLLVPLSKTKILKLFFENLTKRIGTFSAGEGGKHTCCCRVSICDLPKFICWNLNSQDDGIRRRGIWEVISTLIRQTSESPQTVWPREDYS